MMTFGSQPEKERQTCLHSCSTFANTAHTKLEADLVQDLLFVPSFRFMQWPSHVGGCCRAIAS